MLCHLPTVTHRASFLLAQSRYRGLLSYLRTEQGIVSPISCHVSLTWVNEAHEMVPIPWLNLVVAVVVNCSDAILCFLIPDDWCRVRLSTLNPNVTSDYINASYMPVGITVCNKAPPYWADKNAQKERTDFRSCHNCAKTVAKSFVCTVITLMATLCDFMSLKFSFISYLQNNCFSGIQKQQSIHCHSGSFAIHSQWFLEDGLGTTSKRHRHGNQLYWERKGESFIARSFIVLFPGFNGGLMLHHTSSVFIDNV